MGVVTGFVKGVDRETAQYIPGDHPSPHDCRPRGYIPADDPGEVTIEYERYGCSQMLPESAGGADEIEAMANCIHAVVEELMFEQRKRPKDVLVWRKKITPTLWYSDRSGSMKRRGAMASCSAAFVPADSILVGDARHKKSSA